MTCWFIVNSDIPSSFHHQQSIMYSITPDQQQYIISQPEDGHSTPYIASITGISISTISRHCSKYLPTLSKSTGGCPKKLSPTNIHHAVHLITSGKAETAVDIAKTFQTITNNSISTHTVQRSAMSWDRVVGDGLKCFGYVQVAHPDCWMLHMHHSRATWPYNSWPCHTWLRKGQKGPTLLHPCSIGSRAMEVHWVCVTAKHQVKYIWEG